MIYDYCVNNKLSKNQILNVLKEYQNLKQHQLNDVEDIIKECNEFGLSYVSNKYNVTEKQLKQYPKFRFKKRDEKGRKRHEKGVRVEPTNPVVDIFEEGV